MFAVSILVHYTRATSEAGDGARGQGGQRLERNAQREIRNESGLRASRRQSRRPRLEVQRSGRELPSGKGEGFRYVLLST